MPVSEKVIVVGKPPLAAGVKLPAVPTVNVALLALVMVNVCRFAVTPTFCRLMFPPPAVRLNVRLFAALSALMGALKVMPPSTPAASVLIATLAFGLITPPYGLVLLMASKFVGVSFAKALRAALPIYVVFLVTITFTIYFPKVVLWLPKHVIPESVGCFKAPGGTGYICPN